MRKRFFGSGGPRFGRESHLKRLFALCLAACLLAGCGAGPLDLLPRQSAAPDAAGTPAPTEALPRTLQVYDPEGALSAALAAYTEAQGVEVEQLASAEGAALAVAPAAPGGGEALDLAAQAGLVRVLAGLTGSAGACYGLPLGGAQYGYLADAARLQALLGDEFDIADLQKATYGEWETFVQVLAGWIAAPAEAAVTLNGREYTLPAERPGELSGLQAVFTVAGEDQFSGPVLSPVLGTCYKTAEEAAAGGRTAGELTGALNSLWSFLELESANLAGPQGPIKRGQGAEPLTRGEAGQAYWDGAALFYRASYSVLESPGDLHWVVPLKFSFDETDLHGGYSLQELAAQPVLCQGGWIYVPAAAGGGDGQREAEAFLLWLYASEQGQKLAPKGAQAEGLPDLAAALPAALGQAARSQGEALLQKETWQKTDRAAYAAALLEPLQE